MTNPDAAPNGYTREVAVYLERLRRSGETNMYGATPYLVGRFDVDEKIAGAWLMYWMKSYERGDYADIKP